MGKAGQRSGRLVKVRSFIDELYGPDLHVKRIDSLAGATLGVMAAASLAVAMIGQALAQARGLVTKHAIKQVDRLLSNNGIDVWDSFARWVPRDPSDANVYAALAQSRAIFYTPSVCCPFRELQGDISRLITRVSVCIGSHVHKEKLVQTGQMCDLAEILIVDEAERLSNTGLEHLRDLFDRTGIGVVLVGMPGIEKRLSRYPQLYSRVGFAHHYRPLQGDELAFVLSRHWRRLGLALDDADFTDAQAIASIARITGGNFRLLHRLFVQIGRILKINGLSVITNDVVEAARSTLVIGAT